tara:strand:- start:4316 stop:4855 length:540 start_codon:yes stop_codon:yes gene_type:complete
LKLKNKWLKKLVQILTNLLGRKEKEFIPKTLPKDKMLTNKNTEVKGVNLLILRDTFTEESTIGELFLNGERFCDTLELPYRDNQRSISCIPIGQYKVRLRPARQSATRDYLHLLVQNVKNRSHILFHKGNTAKDTRGCILVGQGSQHNIVHNSSLAMSLLIKEILNLGGENINLIIKNK